MPDTSFVREQGAATRYTEKWHRVREWAERAILTLPSADEVELSRGNLSGRVEQLATSRVRDLRDAEEAFTEGLPLELLGNLPRGPRRGPGGYRRVVITALTWVPDHEGEVGYDAAWITIGWGMTAHEAAAAAHRFVRNYERALSQRVASRELIITALEVKFWTESASSGYV